MPPCPFCGKYVGLASKRCASCSQSLELDCPRCGFGLPGLVTRCVRCRSRLSTEVWASALAAPPSTSSPAPEATPRQTPEPAAEPAAVDPEDDTAVARAAAGPPEGGTTAPSGAAAEASPPSVAAPAEGRTPTGDPDRRSGRTAPPPAGGVRIVRAGAAIRRVTPAHGQPAQGAAVVEAPSSEPSEATAATASTDATEATEASAAVLDPLIGRVIDGRYAVERRVGAGGMGTVYRGLQTAMDRPVAIKVLLPSCAGSPDQVARFMAEARTASQLLSPNTVTIHDFGRSEDGRLYLVMEYLAGRSLTEVLQTDGALPWRRALRIVRQAANSLDEAHAKGFLHRDVKPDNIMLVELNNDPDFVKVLDFGIAKSLNEVARRLTATGAVLGTPTYMSPEQARDDALDARSDLYSLGVVLYELIAGRPPFVAETPVSVLLKHCTEAPPELAELAPGLTLPPPLLELLASLLSKAPDERPAGAAELVSRCDELLQGAPARASGPPATEGTGGRSEPLPAPQPAPAESPGEGPPRRAAEANADARSAGARTRSAQLQRVRTWADLERHRAEGERSAPLSPQTPLAAEDPPPSRKVPPPQTPAREARGPRREGPAAPLAAQHGRTPPGDGEELEAPATAATTSSTGEARPLVAAPAAEASADAAAEVAGEAPVELADDELSQEVFDLLRDFLFSPVRRDLAVWRAAPGPGARLRALAPGRLLDEVLDRAEQLPGRAVRLLRRSGAGPVALGSDELQRQVFRRLQPMVDAWEAWADATRGARRRSAVPLDVAVAYDDAAEDATRPRDAADALLPLGPLGLSGLLGRPLSGRFDCERSADDTPDGALARYHAALAAALQSCESAWRDVYEELAGTLGRAGGPRLSPASAHAARWEIAEERVRQALARDHAGDGRGALTAAEAARAALPFEPALAGLALRVASNAGRTAAARQYHEILEEDFPEDPEALEARIDGLVWLGHEDRALDLVDDGLRSHPQHRRLLARQAALLAEVGRWAEALPLANELVARYPDGAQYHLLLARVLGQGGRRGEATRALDAYVRLARPDAETLARIRGERALRGLVSARRQGSDDDAEVDRQALAEELFDPTEEAFYFACDLPPDNARRARSKWLQLDPGEDLLFLIDTSRRGRGGAGVAVTDRRIQWKEGLGATEELDLQTLTLDNVRRVQGGVDLAGRVLGLERQPHLAEPLLQFLTAVARANG